MELVFIECHGCVWHCVGVLLWDEISKTASGTKACSSACFIVEETEAGRRCVKFPRSLNWLTAELKTTAVLPHLGDAFNPRCKEIHVKRRFGLGLQERKQCCLAITVTAARVSPPSVPGNLTQSLPFGFAPPNGFLQHGKLALRSTSSLSPDWGWGSCQSLL